MSLYEINLANARPSEDTRVTQESKIVEVFSSLVEGRKANVDDKTFDEGVKKIKETASRAVEGDTPARNEINTIIKYTVQPHLLRQIQLYNFLGTFKRIGYNETPEITSYKYESIDSRIQASSGDVPFGVYSTEKYPITGVTVSGGVAINYREIATGNFEGTVAEAIGQVETDMRNKALNYVLTIMHDAVKNAKPVVHYSSGSGITKTAVDKMLTTMRRYGRVNIAGDYAVTSQLNNFFGYRTAAETALALASDAAAEEIRRTGVVSSYNGAYVTELPNAVNYNKLNSEGNDYMSVMPQNWLFFLPVGATSPLQMFQRGDLAVMEGDDIVTRTHLIRLDLEVAAGVVKGREDEIGLVEDEAIK